MSLKTAKFKTKAKYTNAWVDVPGYEGVYIINREGTVISLPRPVVNKYGQPNRTVGRTLTPFDNGHGYLHLNMGGKKQYIHRLVATAFIPNNKHRKYVNHKNGIKSDNRVENLEWCTHSENIRHSIEIGLFRTAPKDGDKNPNYKTGKHNLGKYPQICEECRKDFTAKYKYRRFCSKLCAGRSAVRVMNNKNVERKAELLSSNNTFNP